MIDKEHQAIAKGRDLSVSTKNCIEICNQIRNKSTKRAKTILQEAIDKKIPIPFLRFNKNKGHKTGPLYSGAFPQDASKEILNLIKSAEKNAQNQGLNEENLYIKLIMANRASQPFRYGRQKRRKAKRTHVDIILEEKEVTKKKEEKK
ncbi:MAG: 50S ribosomal protein L22 [Candidatus Nanoarchaeia archaeon]|nr:50S ribosomal protein L22 [Candidatus Nanoarchaeia archaeon]